MAFLYSNDALTTLAVGLSTTQTLLYLAVGAGALFPTPSNGDIFSVTLKNAEGTKTEVCWCNYRSGDTLTVLRAQEGTAANTWSSGDLVSCGPTAGTMQSLQPNIASGSTTLSLSNNGLQQWGQSTTYNLVIDYSRIQARFNGVPATLTLNPLGGASETLHNTLDDGAGNTSVAAALTVAGTSTLTGPLTASGGTTTTALTVNGSSNLNGPTTAQNITATGLTVSGSASVTGSVSVSSTVSCAPAVSSSQAVVKSQTLLSSSVNNVTASRAIGVVYTNTTGKMMFVQAYIICDTYGQGYVNGVFVSEYISGGAGVGFGMVLCVPPGNTYEITGACILESWVEVY